MLNNAIIEVDGMLNLPKAHGCILFYNFLITNHSKVVGNCVLLFPSCKV